MDIANLAAVATAMAQTRTAEAVSTAVLRKALDLQAQGAAQLVQAATQSMAAYANPPHLGRNIDTVA